MNIYIPDIKLPKDEPGAFQVIVMYVGADRKLRAECEGTHEVTMVPPHGRLGDLDAFCAKIIEIVERQKYDEKYAQSLSIGEILREVVHELRGEGLDGFANAPTIIPASEEVE